MDQESNHMDELIRKAAENYPLKTDTADWETLRKKLYGKDDSRRMIPVFFLYALLIAGLFTAGWVGYKYFFPKQPKEVAKYQQINLPAQQKNVSSPSAEQNQNPTSTHGNTSPASSPGKQFVINSPREIKKPGASQNDLNLPESNKIPGNNKEISPVISKDPNNNQDVSNSNKQPEPTNTPTTNTTTTIQKEETIRSENDLKANEKPGEPVKEQAVKEETDNSIKKPEAIASEKEHKKENFLYAGLIAAPDFSMVKFQSVKNAGVNAGLIFGYQLNKKLAFETGIMLDKKFYYSDGKYFNTGKITLPPYGKITRVNGNCQMLEVPVNVKYNFKPGKRSQLFVTGGTSSYFMKKENYDYTVVTTGAPYDRYSTYNTSSNYWFSVINASAGYSRPLGKSITLRVEPYVKIPLKGMGIGSMPITSVGINIGLTKKIF